MNEHSIATAQANTNDSNDFPQVAYDLAHHIAALPLTMQHSELVVIHFGSLAISCGSLISPGIPQITAHDFIYAFSYANSLIKRGKAVTRFLAVADFNPITRIDPEDDISFLCSNLSDGCTRSTINLLTEFKAGVESFKCPADHFLTKVYGFMALHRIAIAIASQHPQ
ncbi:hypothetical protein M407DRAFT_7989 [Tulasnella calospora MUT 4182]|uniref:Uncharacterized protein n=1 Tax=Tulasnella calospora MUT 4182 TaxID=1051891 RepID=A0A0C3KXS7_9AGAM|nr:hypothetical protein M407DRAFT_7989 [Tulasnella calospora MUT 4182]